MNDLFDKYYKNELESKQRLDFEAQIRSDTNLRSSYTSYVEMMDHLKDRNKINPILDNLNTIKEERSVVTEAKVRNFKPWIIAAAAIMIPILLYFLPSIGGSQSTEELFANYYSPSTFNSSTKGAEDNTEYLQIIKAYNQQDYNYVTTMAEAALSKGANKEKTIMMVANSYMALKNYEKARSEWAILKHSEYFKTEYYWYTSMCYLAEGNKEEALTFLQKIPESSNYFRKAKEIIEVL